MKTPRLYLCGLALLAAAVLALPDSTHGQAAVDDGGLAGLITELIAQQAVLTENQTKIEAKVAVIAEDLRIARIYVARGGGKAPAR